jgi:NADPH:quinone reductase
MGKAFRFYQHGGPEVLRWEDAGIPPPAAGQVRMRNTAVAVNYRDVLIRRGSHEVKVFPSGIGLESAGVVEAVGPGVTEVRPGERVAYASQMGAYATHALVPARALVPVPAGVSSEVAAAAMLQGMTAHYLTHSTYPLQAGETALVLAAAGGVGGLLTQLAKQRGARVIGAVSTEEKAALARAAGADEIIMYTQADLAQQARRLTGGKGVDVVYDSVGKDTFDKSLDSLRPRGYLVLYGQSSGPVAPLDPQVLNAKGGLFLTRPSLVHYTATREELLQRSGDLFRWIAAGQLTVRVDQTYPLAEAGAAHDYLTSRQTRGKVLLIP